MLLRSLPTDATGERVKLFLSRQYPVEKQSVHFLGHWLDSTRDLNSDQNCSKAVVQSTVHDSTE